MEDVYEYLKNNILLKATDSLVVAVSGGPDSMALLFILKSMYKDNKIICAHVNHRLREESNQEEINLKKYCLMNNVIFECMHIDSYGKDNFHNDARNKRYDFFDKLMNKYKSKYLFTAHHGDDLIETVLMRLTRGSTLKGYAGISLKSAVNNYEIIRPLLFVTKDYLLNFCIANKIDYAVDKSNFSDKYTRNRYRNNVLPFLKKENSNVNKQFLKYSSILFKYDDYIKQVTDEKYLILYKNGKLNIKYFNKEAELIKIKLIEKLLLEIYGKNISLVGSKHVNNIIKILNSKKPNNMIKLPNNVLAIKNYNYFYLTDSNETFNYCYEFTGYVELPNNMVIKTINTIENTSNYVAAFDSKELLLPLYVRSKLDGDKIEVLGLNGVKKVKDIFINEKVNKEARTTYPVLVDSGGKIIWLPGLKKSKYDKTKTNKYDIIVKYD
ncbi:MAG: tRNA lysidine(34) synthetase TilS [Bacilli bacterium]